MAVQMRHNSEQHRYEVEVEPDFWAYLDYQKENNVLIITHTFVPSELRGKGCGKLLMETVLADIEKQDLKVRPVCSYAVVFLQRYRQKYQGLLA